MHKKWEASTLVASYMKSRDRERKSGIPSRSKVIRLVSATAHKILTKVTTIIILSLSLLVFA